MAVYTYDEAIQLIKNRCEQMGGNAALAVAVQVSPAYISAVINGKKPIGAKITKFLGLEPIIIYKDVEEAR